MFRFRLIQTHGLMSFLMFPFSFPKLLSLHFRFALPLEARERHEEESRQKIFKHPRILQLCQLNMTFVPVASNLFRFKPTTAVFLTPDNTEIVVLLFFPYLETLNSIQNTAQCGNISLFFLNYTRSNREGV